MNATETMDVEAADQLVTVQQAAATLSVSQRKVWQLKAVGLLPCVRIGRAVRFRASAVQRLVREGVL